MAKPERHPWPYGPQWNYYPPHVLSLPKIPLPSGPQINSEYNENYLGIRCPEPRRPYQMPPCSTFGSYCHQDNHAVGSYIQSSSIYPPKQYVHRPIPHENFNNSYKFSENIHSYPGYSNNYSTTKDQNNCYQTSWNNTSHYQRKPPELDVRRFLATWQEKDDDFVEMSAESDEQKVSHGYDSTSLPLDCTKRNTSDKPIKRSYENFVNGQLPNATGCVVQPYCIKDNSTSVNRNIIPSEELNNNVPQRNNLNYGTMNSQGYQNKNFYSNTDYWKSTSDKFLSCEHNFTYSQQLNHCDINVNHLRNNVSYRRHKDNLLDTSERSQYNLTSSLESGDLFSDINSRNDDQQKQTVVHPLFSDAVHHRSLNCEEQPYFGHENTEFSENLVYTDLHSMKDSWDLFPSNLKCKEGLKPIEKPKSSVCKLPVHSDYDQNPLNANNTNSGSIMYEGAFNILPNLSDSNIPLNNSVQYNSNNNIITPDNPKTPVISPPLPPNKVSPNVTKCVQGNSKIKPYQFSEEISSDDIDISIASSGDLIVEEEHPTIAPISVINFSRGKKEKVNKPPVPMNKECDVIKNPVAYAAPLFAEKTPVVGNNNSACEKSDVDVGNINVNDSVKHEIVEKNLQKEEESTEGCLHTSSEQNLKTAVMDLSVLKPQNLAEEIILNQKHDDYLDLSNNYFDQSDFVENMKTKLVCDNIDETHALSLQDEKPSDAIQPPSPYLDASITITPNSPNVNKNSEYNSITKPRSDIRFAPYEDDSVFANHSSPHAKENSAIVETLSKNELADSNSDYLSDNHKNEKILASSLNENTTCKSSNVTEGRNNLIKNDNLLLLAQCSQEYGCQIAKEVEGTLTFDNEKLKNSDDAEKPGKTLRDSVIKCSLRWDKIFNVMPDDDNIQPASLDLGPAKVELRMPSESVSSGQWKIVEADNKVQTSSIVQVKRLILKRKSQSEERIPKMVIKKTEGQEYRSYLKKEPNEAVLNCGKFKIYYDISSKSKVQKNLQVPDI